jgi:hypothetical protein
LEQRIEQLEGEKRQLQADLFGRRSETKPLTSFSDIQATAASLWSRR